MMSNRTRLTLMSWVADVVDGICWGVVVLLCLAALLLLSGCKTFRNPTIIEHETFDAQGKRVGHFYYRGEKDLTLQIPARVFVPDADPKLMISVSSLASPVVATRGAAATSLALAQGEVTEKTLQESGTLVGTALGTAGKIMLGLGAQDVETAQIEATRDVDLKKLEPAHEGVAAGDSASHVDKPLGIEH